VHTARANNFKETVPGLHFRDTVHLVEYPGTLHPDKTLLRVLMKITRPHLRRAGGSWAECSGSRRHLPETVAIEGATTEEVRLSTVDGAVLFPRGHWSSRLAGKRIDWLRPGTARDITRTRHPSQTIEVIRAEQWPTESQQKDTRCAEAARLQRRMLFAQEFASPHHTIRGRTHLFRTLEILWRDFAHVSRWPSEWEPGWTLFYKRLSRLLFRHEGVR